MITADVDLNKRSNLIDQIKEEWKSLRQATNVLDTAVAIARMEILLEEVADLHSLPMYEIMQCAMGTSSQQHKQSIRDMLLKDWADSDKVLRQPLPKNAKWGGAKSYILKYAAKKPKGFTINDLLNDVKVLEGRDRNKIKGLLFYLTKVGSLRVMVRGEQGRGCPGAVYGLPLSR